MWVNKRQLALQQEQAAKERGGNYEAPEWGGRQGNWVCMGPLGVERRKQSNNDVQEEIIQYRKGGRQKNEHITTIGDTFFPFNSG